MLFEARHQLERVIIVPKIVFLGFAPRSCGRLTLPLWPIQQEWVSYTSAVAATTGVGALHFVVAATTGVRPNKQCLFKFVILIRSPETHINFL